MKTDWFGPVTEPILRYCAHPVLAEAVEQRLRAMIG
jgi:hypothetical protein